MTAAPVLIFGARLKALQQVIVTLCSGDLSAMLEGVQYTAISLPQLYALAERWGVKAAIEAIEQGAQSYSLNGLLYTRPMLAQLWAMDQEFTTRAATAARRGIGIRYARFG